MSSQNERGRSLQRNLSNSKSKIRCKWIFFHGRTIIWILLVSAACFTRRLGEIFARLWGTVLYRTVLAAKVNILCLVH